MPAAPIQHLQHRLPVTALAWWGDHVILAGEGSYLAAYDAATGHRLVTLEVLVEHSVHGIIPLSPETALVWGGQFLVTVKINGTLPGGRGLAVQKGSVFQLPDWIFDVAVQHSVLGSSKDAVTVAVITAHNALVLLSTCDLEFHETASLPIPIRASVPGSHCVLYSAALVWLNPSQCLIASGTAFGDIIVWSHTLAQSENDRDITRTHYTFSAHEGSVFGVFILDLPQSVLGPRRLLASCSDDRAVCLWDITDLTKVSPSTVDLQRATGFGVRSTADGSSAPLLANAMGHISRIWHVQVYSHPLEPLDITIKSFGEDASMIQWIARLPTKYDGAAIPLKQARTETAHSGKHIWSVAKNASAWLATGGADGSTALYTDFDCGSLIREISLDAMAQSSTNDALKCYKYVLDGVLFTTSKQGQVLCIKLADTEKTEDPISPSIKGLQGYSLVATTDGNAFAAGTDGHIYWYNTLGSKLVKVADAGEKIAHLLAAAWPSQSEGHGGVSALAVRMSGSACIYRFRYPESADAVMNFRQACTHLKCPEGFTIRSYTLIPASEKKCFAAVGSRDGSIAIYTLASFDTGEEVACIHMIPSVHGTEAVTSLTWQSSQNAPVGSQGYLHSTGRDGTHCIQTLEFLDLPTTSVVHRLTLPFGPHVEGCAIVPYLGHLWVWGFKTTRFVVFDITAQREVMRVECGGAHRTWAFQPEAQGGTFIWTKSSKVFRYRQAKSPYRMINGGSHGREIKCAVYVAGPMDLIATGAEDTDIKIFRYQSNGDLQLLQTLRQHNTGIQHLQWWYDSSSASVRDAALLFSSGGFEEFFVWRVTFGVPHVTTGVICQSTHPRTGESDLRIMGFESKECHSTDPVRQHRTFSVVMAYSDSSIKDWIYTESDQWLLRRSIDYLTACLTRVLSMGGPFHASTSTDGHVVLWDLRATPSAQARVKVHQSSILGLHVVSLSDASSLVITGGDDNAIGLTRFEFSRTNSAGDKGNPAKTLLMPRAHAAAVTGLVTVWHKENTLWLFSTSLDQRVRLWEITIDVERRGIEAVVQVRKLHSANSSVADPSIMEMIQNRGSRALLICGAGIEIFSIEGRL